MIKIFFLLCSLFGLLFALDVKVATYNVQNLFDSKIDGSEYKEFVVGQYGWSSRRAAKKFNNTKEALQIINADVVALQEIENEEILKQLSSSLGYRHIAFTKPLNSPVGVGILSKLPILKKRVVGSNIKIGRDFLHVKIKVESTPLDIWVVHLPSLKNPSYVREKALKNLFRAVGKNPKNTLIVGDFNTPLSESSILQKTIGFLHVKEGEWYEPWFEMPTRARWTHAYFKEKTALDRMLVSSDLLDGVGLEYKEGSFQRIDKKPLADKYGNPNRWKISNKGKGKHLGVGYSDHFPLLLTLTTRAFTQPPIITDVNSLFETQEGRVNLRLKKAVVSFVNKDGFILSQNSRGIFVYKPGFTLKKGRVVDVLIHDMKDYNGMREITALHVEKIYPYTINPKSEMFLADRLKEARAGDVIKSITGTVKNGYLNTTYGKIKLYAKEKKLMPRDGLNVKFEGLRVGLYKGEKELILEN